MRIVRSFLRPESIFLPFVGVGIICWAFLPESYLNLTAKVPVTFGAILLISAWYLAIYLSARMGRAVAASYQFVAKGRGVNTYFYLFVTGLATIGALTTFAEVGGISAFLGAFSSLQANELKQSLYDDYSTGSLTLRYAVTISSCLALCRVVIERKFGILDIYNILILLVCAAISARILIFQSAFFFAFVFLSSRLRDSSLVKKVTRVRVYFFASLAVLALVGFTYARSAGTYERQLGISNPFAVTAAEFGRYLGMPIQVTFGVASMMLASDVVDDVQPNLLFLAPSFVHPTEWKLDHSGGVGEQWYAGYFDFPRTLTTNSAFALAVGRVGHWAFLLVPVASFLYALLFYLLRRSEDVEARVAQAVILYAFFELWRTYYFSAGSFFFLNVVMASYIVSTFLLRRRRLVAIQHSG